MRCTALIVAAGRGERMGSAVPKAYLPVAGRAMLRRSIEALQAAPSVGSVRVVYDPGHAEAYADACGELDLGPPIPGGATRQDSVRAGLEALAVEGPPERVLVHDAARPLVSVDLVERVVQALDRHEAVVPGVPVADSLKRVVGDAVIAAVDRSNLVRSQTPQGFRFAPLLDAHRKVVGEALTDDAAVVAAVGIGVAWVEGEEGNIKLTRPEDMMLAETRLAAPRSWRTGQGIDVHAFAPGRRLVLGGVEIPSPLGLAGHSDADVVLHALTDALLGTIGAGDIGTHFPPSDARWRDADSSLFLRHAVSLVGREGGRVEHVDVTLLAERPKIGPHRQAMQERIGALLGILPARVGLKATTTERLGFVGREEGVLAQAIATVSFPA